MNRQERTEKNSRILDDLLSEKGPFNFNFYYGETKRGYLRQYSFDDFYIVNGSEVNELNNCSDETKLKILTEKGYKIIPETLESYNETKPLQNIIQSKNIDTANVKKLIIIGAGASYDFSSSYIEKIPLTKSIFSEENYEYLQHFPGAHYYIDLINADTDLEAFFQKQWDSVTKSYNIHALRKIINTQYFLHYLFYKKSYLNKSAIRNHYKALVAFLDDYCHSKIQKAAIVSFNYDTLLEDAIIKNYNIPLNTVDSYIENTSNLLLFKPHGSANWIRKVKGTENKTSPKDLDIRYMSQFYYNNNINLHEIKESLEDEVLFLNDFYEYTEDGRKKYPYKYRYYPEILLPYKDKDDFIMPNSHANQLKNVLSSIDEILIIGWKGSEKKFNELLKQKIGNRDIKVTFFNADDTKVIDNLTTSIPNAKFSHGAMVHEDNRFSGFTDFVSLIQKNQFNFSS